MTSRSGKSLRDPQPTSVADILRIWEHGARIGSGSARGALLADSMGLGKTATAAVAAAHAGMNRVLVIAPKSALPDWRREVHDWVKYPAIVTTLRPGKSLFDFDYGWCLVNYELLERYAVDLRSRPWDLLILDEAHATKEPEARRTILVHGGVWGGKGYARIPSRKALVISGTPHKNRIEELYTTLNFLDPDRWPDRDEFIDEFYESTTSDGMPRIVTQEGRVVQNVATRNLDVLHRRLKESVLVRTDKDKLAGFPSKRFEKVSVPLDDYRDAEWFNAKAKTQQFLSRQLRQAQRARDYDEAQDLETKLRQLTSVVTQHATRCKREAILDYLLGLTGKTVVIGYHREVLLDQLVAALRARGRGVVEHNGSNSHQAQMTVEAFQNDPSVQFFIGQLSVSNLSLTLTASAHVVFAEIPTTRADFDQALDRIHRFGQAADEVLATVFALEYHSAGDGALLDALEHWKDVSDVVLDGAHK
jgi:SWI/SNF-related matrix-associated actin-dependent regulator 1 of chromatin subfamily A